MTVRVVRRRDPRPGDNQDGTYEEAMKFETVYRVNDRLLAFDPVDESGFDGFREYNYRFVKEIDFEHLTIVPFSDMIRSTVHMGAQDFDDEEDLERPIEKLT